MLALLLLFVCAGEPQEERAAALANEGTAAFDRGDYVQALVRYREAEELLRFQEQHQQERALLLYLIGSTYERLGEVSKAISNYTQSLEMPLENSYRTRAKLRRDALRPLEPGRLRAACEWRPARVSVAGRPTRSCSEDWELPPGTYTATVSQPLGEDTRIEFRVRPRETTVISIARRERPSIRVESSEDTASVLPPLMTTAGALAGIAGGAVAAVIAAQAASDGNSAFEQAMDPSLSLQRRRAAADDLVGFDVRRDRSTVASWVLLGVGTGLTALAIYLWHGFLSP